MTEIIVYGTSCSKCKVLHKNTLKAVKGHEDKFNVSYVTDMEAILDAGIMITPVLTVNGERKISGQTASVATIQELLGI